MTYHHTQRGWLIYVILVLVSGIMATTLVMAHAPVWMAAVMPVLVAALVFAISGWLTVEVDSDSVRVRFGAGLIRRDIPVQSIAAAKVTKPEAYAGIGAHWIYKGWLYNIAPGKVVELTLADGARVQIGSDEPAVLLAAIDSVRGSVSAPSGVHTETVVHWKPLALLPLIIGGGALVAAGLDARTPTVELRGDTLRVASAMYSSLTVVRDIRTVDVVPKLPRLDHRSNGFAAGGRLRGHFISDTLGGAGMVFIDRDHPPFVVVKTGESFVVFTTTDSARTRLLAGQLLAAAGR